MSIGLLTIHCAVACSPSSSLKVGVNIKKYTTVNNVLTARWTVIFSDTYKMPELKCPSYYLLVMSLTTLRVRKKCFTHCYASNSKLRLTPLGLHRCCLCVAVEFGES